MDLLRTRLIEWDLAPEETVGDGNCFFRTVSRMIYATDEFYHMVRTQAVERVQDHPEDYQFLFLHQYDSSEDYISQMGTDRNLADKAIIRATADALQIEIHIISSYFSNIKDTVTLEFTFFLKNIFFHKYTVFLIYYKFSKQKV